MIIATAGHVDHGKTTLVHALTGVDTDRLAEEKKRGITIDLGFAYMPLPDGSTLGFVDVPGHRKFVHTMVAGAAAVDFGLLVIAADDGPMPQTHEHLDILHLLGIRSGACVITKCDTVMPDRIATVTEEVQHLIENTSLKDSPVFPVSAQSGDGLDPLREHLRHAAQNADRRFRDGPFRFVIDRAFNVVGSGTVVTGTVVAGQVAAGDRLVLAPAGHTVRVRGIRTQEETVTTGCAGQRVGINISGTGSDMASASRGQLLVASDRFAVSRRIDAAITLAASETETISNKNKSVHMHIGAADVEATLKVLDPPTLAPGGEAIAHLILKHPISSICGERFILRDRSATRTIGGGRVIDPLAPSRRITAPARIDRVRAADADDPRTALHRLLAFDDASVDVERFLIAWNVSDADAGSITQSVDAVVMGSGADRVWISQARHNALLQQLSSTLDGWHAAHPSLPGIATAKLHRALARDVPASAFGHLLERCDDVRVVRGDVALTSFKWSLAPEAEKIWQDIRPLIAAAGDVAPRVVELSEATATPADRIVHALDAVTRAGLVHRVAKNRYYVAHVLHRLAKVARDCAAADPAGTIDVKAFRDATPLGRNLAIEMLEYFDACGFTVRRDDRRTIIGDEDVIFSEPLDNGMADT